MQMPNTDANQSLTSTPPSLCPSAMGPPPSLELVAPATAQQGDAKRKIRFYFKKKD